MCLLCCCRLVWKPFLYLDDSDVAGSLAKAGAVTVGAETTGFHLRSYPPLYTR